MLCPNCKREIAPGDTERCPHCHQDLQEATVANRDQVGRDKIEGDAYSIGEIKDARSVAIGQGSHAIEVDSHGQGIAAGHDVRENTIITDPRIHVNQEAQKPPGHHISLFWGCVNYSFVAAVIIVVIFVGSVGLFRGNDGLYQETISAIRNLFERLISSPAPPDVIELPTQTATQAPTSAAIDTATMTPVPTNTISATSSNTLSTVATLTMTLEVSGSSSQRLPVTSTITTTTDSPSAIATQFRQSQLAAFAEATQTAVAVATQNADQQSIPIIRPTFTPTATRTPTPTATPRPLICDVLDNTVTVDQAVVVVVVGEPGTNILVITETNATESIQLGGSGTARVTVEFVNSGRHIIRCQRVDSNIRVLGDQLTIQVTVSEEPTATPNLTPPQPPTPTWTPVAN
ncbi:hypothetical protein KFU94_04445 [Chloroflexi bacterium TSY]|nr:hypothetical protein [Chloroflexi bacterium TSY]